MKLIYLAILVTLSIFISIYIATSNLITRTQNGKSPTTRDTHPIIIYYINMPSGELNGNRYF